MPSRLRAFVIVAGVCVWRQSRPRADTPRSATTASPRWPAMSSSSPPRATCGRRRSAAACPSGSPRIPGKRPTRRCRPTASGSPSPAPTRDPPRRTRCRSKAARPSASPGTAVPVRRVVDAGRQGALRDPALLHAAQHARSAIDPATKVQTAVPLAQASDGVYAADGTLYFTRLPFQGSHTRRYKGGTAQQHLALCARRPEAVPHDCGFRGHQQDGR